MGEDKMLDLLARIQQWTFISIQNALNVVMTAIKNNGDLEDGTHHDVLECRDTAKSCGKHLCSVEVVANMCKKTCGICPNPAKICKNAFSDTYCAFSAGMGYCNHQGISENCKDSCNKCPEDCEDYDQEFCEM